MPTQDDEAVWAAIDRLRKAEAALFAARVAFEQVRDDASAKRWARANEEYLAAGTLLHLLFRGR